jgi:hypothetical protein
MGKHEKKISKPEIVVGIAVISAPLFLYFLFLVAIMLF